MKQPMRRMCRPAVAAVELACVLPFITTLLLGLWEVGRLVEVQQILSNAVREGARQAATGTPTTNSTVQTVVLNYLTEAGLSTTNATVTVSDLTHSGTDVSNATYLDQLQISVSIPFSSVRWSALSLFISPSTNITAQVQWITMVDQTFSGFPTPPAG